MIKVIHNLLQMDDFYIGDPDIDFAKGGNKLPTSIKETIKHIKRQLYTRWQG